MYETQPKMFREQTEESDYGLSQIEVSPSRENFATGSHSNQLVLRKSCPGTTIRDASVTIPVKGGDLNFYNCSMLNCRIIDARSVKITYKKSLISIF